MIAPKVDRAVTIVKAVPGPRNILYLRMMELLAFFIIVSVAKLIAGFQFEWGWMIALFVGATALHTVGHWFWEQWGRRNDWSAQAMLSSHLWSSSLTDFVTVIIIIYFTGTIESPFLFLLVVPLFFASHVFSWKATVICFLGSALAAVAVLGYLELREIMPHFHCYGLGNGIYQNTHYYIGTLLVLGGFLSLILFLSNAFRDHFIDSMRHLRQKEKEKKDKISELSRLYDISLGINAVMTVETLLKMVAKEATLLLSQPWAGLILINEDREITHSALVGIPEQYHSALGSRVRKNGLSEWIVEDGKPVVVEDVLADKRASTGEFLIATNIRSLVGLPLNTGQRVLGVIYVGDFVRKQFEDRDLRLLAIIADQLVIAIAKSQLYESIQRKLKYYEKRSEDLEKTSELKSEYVGHVSHELRTPLTAIKAYLETLEQHIEDPSFNEKHEFLGIVSKETDRLIRIVHEILDVSNIEFGQRALQVTNFNLEEVIYEVISTLQPKLVDKGMKVECVIPENLPKVSADKDLMVQVFINLISNAVKYSPSGTTVRICAKEEPVDVSVSVADEGIGIPESQLEKIFDKYFRVKSEKSRHYDGVGLGLAIVKNIIEQHGGNIAVSSKEDVGTKFTFTVSKERCVNDLLGFISEGIGAKSELHELLTLVVRMMAELLSAKIVSLMLLNQERTELFIKVSYGLDEWIVDQARVKVGEGIAGKVAETGLPLLIDNIEENGVYESPNNPQYETMSLLSVPLRVNDVLVGVINVNNKLSGEPFDQDDMNLLTSFAERISVSLERLRTARDETLYLQDTIAGMKKLLDKQIETKAIETVVNLAVKIARKLRLNEKEVKVIQYVASVHDIGMSKISDDILNKTFKLAPEELREIQSHPQIGTDLMRPLEFVEIVSNIILYHHERVDGLGYPMGLKGDQIPIGARILSIIDAYDSMTSARPYREPLTTEAAVKELVECAGRQFDSEVVAVFIEIMADDGKLTKQQAKKFKRVLKGVMQDSAY